MWAHQAMSEGWEVVTFARQKDLLAIVKKKLPGDHNYPIFNFLFQVKQVSEQKWGQVFAKSSSDSSSSTSSKGAGSFHIHRKTMKELGILALLGIRERPNLAQNLVTH